MGPLNPGDSIDVSVTISQPAPGSIVEITINPDSNGLDEVTLLNNSTSAIVYAESDFNRDTVVSFPDFSVLASYWMATDRLQHT